MRNARHIAGWRSGWIPSVGCTACTRHSRAYLHHLFRANEMLGPMLLTQHNLTYYHSHMQGMRRAILEGRLADYAAGGRGRVGGHDDADAAWGSPRRCRQSPAEAVLERVPNPEPGRDYLVRFTAPEFTSLCPMTAQPDFAHIVIDYVPGDWLVESKSLEVVSVELPEPWGVPRGLHDDDRGADRGFAGAAVVADRGVLVSAGGDSDRRVLAERGAAAGFVAAGSGGCGVSRARVRVRRRGHRGRGSRLVSGGFRSGCPGASGCIVRPAPGWTSAASHRRIRK